MFTSEMSIIYVYTCQQSSAWSAENEKGEGEKLQRPDKKRNKEN